MSVGRWLNDMRLDLAELEKLGRSLTKDGNIIYPPPPSQLLADFISRLNSLGIDISSQIASFYKECNGIYLTDVHNGYFIWPIDIILRNLDTIGPTKISGPKACSILVFGDDGGGQRFALRTGKSETVLFLPEGAVIDFVFDGESTDVKQLSKDFYGFLKRLQADMKADIDNNESWEYMTD